MKKQHNSRIINLRNLEAKNNWEEKLKKRMKEMKEKKINKQSNLMEKKINYEKRNLKIDKSMMRNDLLKNMKPNNNNNRQINNSGFIKREKNKKENNLNNRTTYNYNKKNLIKKQMITNQNINKNYNTNNSKIYFFKAKTINDTDLENNKNKYMNKTIEIDKKNNLNNENNNCNYAINNNILCVINSSNDNIMENFAIDNLHSKKAVYKNNSSSKLYSSPNKNLKISNYDEFDSNINKKVIYTNKNNFQKKDIKEKKAMYMDNNISYCNYIYKKNARNNSCLRREKYDKNIIKETKKENEVNVLNKNLNSPLPAFYIKKDRSLSNYGEKENKKKFIIEDDENIALPINEDFNRKKSNKKYYIYQNGINDSKSFIEKNNNINKIYDKIKAKKLIKTSLRKRRLSNSFAIKDTSNNELNKNNQTIFINRRKELNNLNKHKNHCNLYLNEEINDADNNFNKTVIHLYQNNKRIFETLKIKDIKDNNNIKKRENFFYNDDKTLENFFNSNDKTKLLNCKTRNIQKNIPPILNNLNNRIYTNKLNNLRKTTNKIYFKKNINDKNHEINNYTKSRTLNREKSKSNTSTINYDKENKEENNFNDSEFYYSFDEKINETINNNNHCFQKKIYNYFIKKPKIKISFIDRIIVKKNIKEKLLINNSFNLPNISEIENKTSSLKNISKEYNNFELSELDEKNDKISIDIKDDKKSELSSFQKISLGAKKLNEIFEKKNEPEVNKKIKRTITEENFYLGYSKLNDVIHRKSNIFNQNESTKEESNNNIQINKKIYTYKMPIKNKLQLEEEDNNLKIHEIKKDKINDDIKRITLNNTNNNFYSKINEINEDNNNEKISNNEEKKKLKKSKSTEKRNLDKLINKEIKKEKEVEEINKKIILEDLENYLNYLEKEKINKKEDIYEGINDSYNWKVIDELITTKNIKVENIIKIYIDICKENNFINKNNIFKINEYIKTIIEYYTNNLTKNQKEIIHLNMIEIFNDIDNIINNSNEHIYEILGNLFFILLKNKLYYMKDLNNFIEKEKSTQINIAKIVKYSILSSGNLLKQYHNDFKYTKLFNNNDIFINYITKEIFDKEKK